MYKKIFLLLLIFVFCLSGGFNVNAYSSLEKKQNSNKDFTAKNIKIVKKIPASEILHNEKGKPSSPPGQSEDDEPAGDFSATGVIGNTPNASSTKYAIIIGICDYPGTENDICESDGDSFYMYYTLTHVYGYHRENIRWFRDMGGEIHVGAIKDAKFLAPTKSSIVKAINEIKDLSNKELPPVKEVTFFFSGHGASGELEEYDEEKIHESILVHNDDSTGLDYLWDVELVDYFTGFSEDVRKTFIFDSCLSGGMDNLKTVSPMVVMSTDETSSAYVASSGALGEGVFSRLFVHEGMMDGMADGYNNLKEKDGFVVVEEAFGYAKENIPAFLKRKQKPQISDGFEDDLLL